MTARLTSNEQQTRKGLAHNIRRNTCIQCGSLNLNLFFALEQDMRAPEYSHALIALCAHCGKGQLERTYSDTGDLEDAFEQTEWFLLDNGSMERLRRFIEQTSAEDSLQRKLPPCSDRLSPNCLCGVHWQLIEAAKRLELSTMNEKQESSDVVMSMFSLNEKGLPSFERYA